jgi:hypothetical protein
MKKLITIWNFLTSLMGIKVTDRKQFGFYVLGVICGAVAIKYFSVLMMSIPILMFLGMFLFVLFMWGYAGVIVFRSVLPASVALSLLLFLGIEYCQVLPEFRTADDSLRYMMAFGLAYVAFQFGLSLFKELVGNKKAEGELQRKGVIEILKEVNKGKHDLILLMTLGFVVALFVWHFGMVVSSLVQNMCIYR